MTTWTGQAQILADAIREPGFAAAAVSASAFRARVDPDATHGFVGAALTLTDGDAAKALWADMPPCPDDRTLLTQAAELEAAVAGLLEWARRMAAACRADLEAAVREHDAAVAQLNAAVASAAMGNPGGDGAAAAAMDRREAALRIIADCEAALEILAGCEGKLAHALNCLRQVPGDLGSTYEVPYQFVHDGGKLPYSGDFLSDGIVTIGAA